MGIVVFGSLNMDLVVRSPRLPQPGETLAGSHFETVTGGKGANQAVAAARFGAHTRMVGRVGADDFGHQLRHGLTVAGVDSSGVVTDSANATGVAAIAVADDGENHIVIVPGANGQVGEDDVVRLQAGFQPGEYLLMQLEIPLLAVVAAAQAARARGLAVMLDPAPAPATWPDALYQAVDILTPNQGEVTQLVGQPVTSVDTAIAAAHTLQQRGIPTVIIKLGALGSVAVQGSEVIHVPAFTVPVVDTVAAGDAYNGALAVALTEQQPLPDAMRWASAAAALAVTQPGAQPSLPMRSQVEAFLAQH
jgi:ribokinase